MDAKLEIQQLSGDDYQFEILDYDGGLRSGSGTATLSGDQLTMTGSISIEMGTASLTATLDFNPARDQFSGQFEVLDPNDAVILASSINGQAGDCEYDYDADDVAQVAQVPVLDSLHVDLDKIFKVSRYRSAAGHNFVDYSGESCVNLKHYFLTYSDPQITSSTVLPTSLDYFAPAAGTIVSVAQPRPETDPNDLEVDIQLDSDPNIIVRIFHMTLIDRLSVGSHLNSGERIGEAPSSHLNGGDLAVYVKTSEGYRHISAFEIMTQTVLTAYEARGVSSSNWANDLYYDVNDPYVSGIYCDNGDWGNLRHPNMNALDDYFNLN